MKKPNKKEMVLEIAARQMHLKGYNNTGIQEILNEAQIPKGSFYFYFKSKEDLGLQVIEYFGNFFTDQLEAYLNQKDAPRLQNLKTFFEDFLSFFIEGNYEGGCPIGNLALEMADVNEKFRTKLDEVFSRGISKIQNELELAKEEGVISQSLALDGMAQFIFFSWEGMIMQMKLKKDSQPLENFKQMVFEHLLY